ncbi:MAG: MATE family efflux transporter, partial [Paracoccaceae bacterium]
MPSPDLTEVAERPAVSGKSQAKFLTGSTMRHVVVMTLTGSLGLSFLFLVDFLALWWISRLENEVLITAIGFAGTIQFFVMSVAVGMMIGAVALVSRALGMGDPEEARRIATSAMIYGASFQTALAVLVFI